MLAVGVLCAKVALVVLVFDPFAFNVFAQPKGLSNNAFDVLLLGLLAGLMRSHARSIFGWSLLHIPVLIFAGAYGLATVFALDQRVALFGTTDRGLGLVAALDGVFLYFAGFALLRTTRDLAWLGGTLAVLAALVVLYEAVQWLGIDPIEWAGGASQDRVFATLGNRGVLAQFLGSLSIAAAGVAIARQMGNARARGLAVAVALIALGGALLSGGRAAMLGIAAGGAVLGVLRVMWEDDRRTRLLGAAAAVGLAAAILGVALLTPTGQRVVAFLRDPGSLGEAGFVASDPSIGARMDLYRVTLDIWRERPVLGAGPDNYAVAFPAHRTPASIRLHDFAVAQTSTHSWLFKILTDAGLLGLGAFLGALGLALFLVARGQRQPWRLAAAGGLAAFLGTGIVSVNHIGTEWLPWLSLGVIAAPVSSALDGHERTQDLGRRRGRRGISGNWEVSILEAAVAVFVLALAVISISGPLQAARQAQASRVALSAGDPGRLPSAIAAAHRAVSLDPGRAEYWDLLGTAQFRSGDAEEAARTWSRASDLAPYQVGHLANAALAELDLGLKGDRASRAAALETARRAAALDPYVPRVQYMLALTAGANGKYQDTIDAGELFLQLGGLQDVLLTRVMSGAYLAIDRPVDAERWVRPMLPNDVPDQPDMRILLARALAAQGRSEEALRQLDLALTADPKHEAGLRLRAEIGSP